MGSEGCWDLKTSWLDDDCVAAGIYTFVLTGQSIDRKMYDALNSYTDEAGSDGVVRVAGANMNYSLLRLSQDGSTLKVDKLLRTAPTAIGVLPGLSHSGEEMGIIRSVTLDGGSNHPTSRWVLRCLRVGSSAAYRQVSNDLAALTEKTQIDERKEKVKSFFGSRTYPNNRHSMVVFRVTDDAATCSRITISSSLRDPTMTRTPCRRAFCGPAAKPAQSRQAHLLGL